MAESHLLQLILNRSHGLYFSLALTKSRSCMCRSVFFFFFDVLVWEDQGLLQCSPCVLWARGAWLSSCHTVAHGTCPLIWTDLPDLSAGSLHRGLSAPWNVSTEASSAKINNPNLTAVLKTSWFFYLVSSICNAKLYIQHIYFFTQRLDTWYHFSLTWYPPTYGWVSWPAFSCSFEPTVRGFWGNAFLCFIGNRCREEHFFCFFFELNLLECLKTVQCGP